MTIWEFLGRTFCAMLTAVILGGLAYLTLDHFFPTSEAATSSISNLALAGTGLVGLLGFGIGWRYAMELADSIIGEVLGRLLVGAISVVFKAF